VNLEAFLQEILTPMLEHPDQFRVEVTENGRRCDVLIHAEPSDRGRVIGRSGRLISSLRTLCKLAGEKTGQQVNLEIYDEEPRREPPRSEGH
jgi:uncharacterized protein